jgi:hypothetical protein
MKYEGMTLYGNAIAGFGFGIAVLSFWAGWLAHSLVKP